MYEIVPLFSDPENRTTVSYDSALTFLTSFLAMRIHLHKNMKDRHMTSAEYDAD